MSSNVRNIVLAVTGGIAAYKSAILVRRLKDYGFDVRVVMTKGAQAFVTPLTFQALSGYAVHTELLDANAESGMGHIELAKWADLLLVAPATCDVLAKFANGLADDLLSTIYLATQASVCVVPAMNQQMWAAKATQRNLEILRQDGVEVVIPDAGRQACGDIGFGRMPEPEVIAALIANQKPQKLKNKHIVITAGPTQEAMDPVRYISNHSTGKMGFALAKACIDAGAKVTLIAGPVHLPTPQGVERINVISAEQMLHHSLQYLESDVFIATAAVADYRMAEVATQKLKKSGDQLQINLIKNPDIVATVAAQPKHPLMVGFAAETQNVENYASTKLKTKKLDIIACNDVSRQDIGFGADDNAMTVFFAPHYHQPKRILAKASKYQIAEQLIDAIVGILQS